VNDLDELKNLLFGAEKQVLDSIQQRVQLPEARAADIAAVLPEAVRISDQQNEQLVNSLQKPVVKVLRQSFHDSPQEFGDALYPVMGPAIRKSITHTLKAFAQQINQTLEHSLTLKGLSWRFRAARAGIPFASYIIQQSLLYRVEQAYMISRENGLLIGHVHHDASRIKDSDAVSAMFTAIQDFVKESFSPDRSGRLETADMGEFTLWAVHGPHALLVCVIRGVPPQELRNELNAILEQLHFRYGDKIRQYAGDTASVAGIEDELRRCLQFEAARPAESRRKIGWPLLIVLGALLGFGLYALWNSWQYAEQRQQLQTAIADTPGLHVSSISRDGDTFVLHGLRDPLAAEVDDVAVRAGLEPGRVSGQLRPYQSLEDPIRLVRARTRLAPGEGTRIDLQDGALVISGTASADWIRRTRDQAAALDLGWPLRFDQLQAAEWNELTAMAADLQNTSFYFGNDAELLAESAGLLATAAPALVRLTQLADDIAAGVAITITGHTDGVGTEDYNSDLADERAGLIRDALRAAGIPAGLLRTERSIPQAGGEVDPRQRRASISIEVDLPETLSP
jgi:outer membrane protein OmpA-like peptidoglycan-associated protein